MLLKDDAPRVAATVILLSILAYLTFGLRAYVRISRSAWGLEDWFMTIAMVGRARPSKILHLGRACLF
jgi:hypothetical protein